MPMSKKPADRPAKHPGPVPRSAPQCRRARARSEAIRSPTNDRSFALRLLAWTPPFQIAARQPHHIILVRSRAGRERLLLAVPTRTAMGRPIRTGRAVERPVSPAARSLVAGVRCGNLAVGIGTLRRFRYGSRGPACLWFPPCWSLPWRCLAARLAARFLASLFLAWQFVDSDD